MSSRSAAATGRLLAEKVVDPEQPAMIRCCAKQLGRRDLAMHAAGLHVWLSDQTSTVSAHQAAMSRTHVVYLTADEEEQYIVAQANVPLTAEGEFLERSRQYHGPGRFVEEPDNRIDFMDVSPRQIVSVATAMIPFLEHDDANRALMGSNMQRQAVALLRPEAPIVGTGMEWRAAHDSGQVVVARDLAK